MLEEEGPSDAATVLCVGTRLSKGAAAFVNSEMVLAGGKWDTFRMLTHPGAAIIPAALAAAEVTQCSGRDFLVGLVAGYEVMERMAAEFIPTVMARGFHAGPVFGIFGAAVAVAKIQQLSEDQIHSAIAQCVNLAGGNLEGGRSGGRSLREGAAVRNAMLAVSMARLGTPGGETTLEGAAGFYHAYAGNNAGLLTHSFTGKLKVDLSKITEGLGRDWMFLETLYRIYSVAGINNAHIDVTAQLSAEHSIRHEDISHIEAVVNWFETKYPSPAFPMPGTDDRPRIGSTHYFTAYGAVTGSYPMLRNMTDTTQQPDPPAVLDLMKRVRLIPSVSQPLFAPRITIFTNNGSSFTRQATGREFIWDFDEEVSRIRPIEPGIALSAEQFTRLIESCRGLDRPGSVAAALIPLTIAA
jgi:2-methylcitrate dehydratase PrpD